MNFDEKLHGDGLDQKEHKALYNAIVEAKPSNVFEIGTRKGGGSTLYISKALKEVGYGVLFTVECNKEAYETAVNTYKNRFPELNKYINFLLGKSQEVFSPILEAIDKVDFVFLDGEENSDRTIEEFNMFSPKFAVGTRVACHDWNIGKMKKLKPILLDSSEWEQLVEINDTLTGFSVFKKVK